MSMTFVRRAVALVALGISVAPAPPATAADRKPDYQYAGSDFVSHGRQHARAPDVATLPFSLDGHLGAAVILDRNSGAAESFQDVQQIIDRLMLSGTLTGVRRYSELLKQVIVDGDADRYADLRSDAGMARYSREHGGFLLVQYGTFAERGISGFELAVIDPATSRRVFVARNRVKNSTAFFRWDGISNNEIINPCINSFIDWYRARISESKLAQ